MGSSPESTWTSASLVSNFRTGLVTSLWRTLTASARRARMNAVGHGGVGDVPRLEMTRVIVAPSGFLDFSDSGCLSVFSSGLGHLPLIFGAEFDGFSVTFREDEAVRGVLSFDDSEPEELWNYCFRSFCQRLH